MATRRGDGPMLMDPGTLRLRALHPQSHQGVCADAIVDHGRRISRERHRSPVAAEPAARRERHRPMAIFDKSLVPVYREDGTPRARSRRVSAPANHAGSAVGPAGVLAIADYPIDDKGTTHRSLILDKYPDLEINHVHHAGNSSGVVDGSAGDPAGFTCLCQGARPEAARAESLPWPTWAIRRH